MIAPQSMSPMAGRRGSIAATLTSCCLGLALWLLSCVARISVAQSPQVYDIDLPAESVAEALNGLSEKTGVPAVFPYDLVKDRRANPVAGHYTLLGALDALLKDTGLSGGLSDKGVLTVSLARPSAPDSGDTSVMMRNQNQQNTNKTRAPRPAGIVAFFTSIAAAFSVSAQDSDGGAANLDNGADKLDVVLVTAQKKVERAQDVPITMTVLNPESLAENGQTRLVDYFADVPGLSLNSNAFGGGTEYVTLRGLSTGFSFNPTVATVIDDVPVGSSTQVSWGMLTSPDLDPSDLARIEVLKGPQGTLYGSDSLGGLIKYVTADPSTTNLNGRAEVTGVDIPEGGVGYVVRGAVNVPLSDTFAMRLSGFTRRDPGYIDNLTTGENNVNSVDVHGGHISLLYRPGPDLSVKLSALIQNTDGNANSYINSNAQEQFTQGDLKVTGLPGTGPYYTRWQLYTATLNAKIGGLDLVSVTGYGSNTLHNWEDFSGSSFLDGIAGSIYPSAPAYVQLNYYHTDKVSQELRLSSSVDHWFDWLLGGFYTHESSPGTSQQAYGANASTGIPMGLLFNAQYAPLKFTEYALFGDLTFHITDRFELQIGGREAWNTLLYESAYVGPGVPAIFSVSTTDFEQPIGRASGHPFTYLVTPRYVISPNLNIYARIASGYRIGGPNLLTAQLITDGAPSEYKPDKTTNYELGIKADILEHRLSFDAAAYYINWKSFQLNVSFPDGNGYTTNAGNAKSEGVELDVQSHPLTGLTLSVQGSYNHAVLTQDIPSNAAGVYGLAGDPLPYSIKFSGGAAVNQDVRLMWDWVGFVGGAVNYVGSRASEFAGAPPPATRTWMPGYTQLNLRTGVRSQSWLVNLYVNNVANRRGIVGFMSFANNAGNIGGNSTVVTQPRTVGVNISKTF